MKNLLLLLMLLFAFTSQAQITIKPMPEPQPEPIYTLEIGNLLDVMCEHYVTHITKESCVNQVSSCIFNILRTRHPALVTFETRLAHAYLYCTENL